MKQEIQELNSDMELLKNYNGNLSDGLTIILDKNYTDYRYIVIEYKHGSTGVAYYEVIPTMLSLGVGLTCVYTSSNIYQSYGEFRNGNNLFIIGSTSGTHVYLTGIYGIR